MTKLKLLLAILSLSEGERSARVSELLDLIATGRSDPEEWVSAIALVLQSLLRDLHVAISSDLTANHVITYASLLLVLFPLQAHA